MAKLIDVLIKGSVDNLVFYRRMGVNCVRTRRKNIRQTEATRKRGLNFGIAARAGRGLREGLQEVMPEPSSRSAQSRLSGAVARWLGQTHTDDLVAEEEIPYLNKLPFAEGQGLDSRFSVPLHISRTEEALVLTSAAFCPMRDIAAPAGTVRVEMVVSVSGCALPEGRHTGHQTFTCAWPYVDEEVPGISLGFERPRLPANLIVMAARLLYFSATPASSVIRQPAFTAAGIIHARYETGEG